MSLVGNLEDLGLGEILQIVSLSRKSGVLQLTSREREGRVIFFDGQVIRASASTHPENLGDLVLREGMADMEMLKKALVIQQKSDDERRIGDILVSDFGVDREDIEKAVREQVEKVVYSFFSWDEGSFSFELGDPGELAATNLNPLQFMLDSGLNPQWLAMEGSRLLDEGAIVVKLTMNRVNLWSILISCWLKSRVRPSLANLWSQRLRVSCWLTGLSSLTTIQTLPNKSLPCYRSARLRFMFSPIISPF